MKKLAALGEAHGLSTARNPLPKGRGFLAVDKYLLLLHFLQYQ